MKKLTLLASLALALACGGQSSSSRMSLYLTDAPAKFNAAVVTITRIDLVGSAGVTTLSTKKTTTNLLSLANDAAKLVDDVEVQPGTYTELRFVISGGYVDVPGEGIFATSSDYEGLPAGATVAGQLKMPSYAQSGLKVSLPGDSVTVSAGSKILLVDFDVQQSFGHEAGNSGSWVMHPSLKADDLTLSGNVDVTLTAGTSVKLPSGVTLDQFTATLTSSEGSEHTVAFSSTGTATFKYLLPGSYTASVVVPANLAATITPSSAPVSVGSGAATSASFTISSIP